MVYLEKQRLDRLIANQGEYSRKDVHKLINAGNISVDGIIIKNSGCLIAVDADIKINGRAYNIKKNVYIMLNKPKGIISASNDKNAATVIDLLPDEIRKRGVFPAGRLDIDTTGFMLITDDGDFAHRILSPKNHVKKTYIASLENLVSDEAVNRIEAGITLADGTECLPAEVTVLSNSFENIKVEIIINEGKYHQIKRMFAATGNSVNSLMRVKIGNLPLDNRLKGGEFKFLSENEVLMIEQKI